MKGRSLILILLLSLGLVFGVGFSPAFAQVIGVNHQSGGSILSPVSQSGAQSQAQGTAFNINESSQQYIPNAPFFPLPVPLISGGRVGDVTDQLPNFAGMKKLRLPYIKENGERKEVDLGETVNPEKIASFFGCWYNRVMLQDLWIELAKDYKKMQDKGWEAAKMRYRVYYKDRAKGMGMNLGGSGGGSGIASNGMGVQGSVGGVLGYSSSTADPLYIVMICEVME